MERNYNPEQSIRGTLREMQVEDVVHFPVSKLSVVRTTAANLGLEMCRKYKTRASRKTRTIDVTRLA